MTAQTIGWNFDTSYENLPQRFYSKVHVNKVKSPRLVLLNELLAEELGLRQEALREDGSVEVLAGNSAPEHSAMLAQAYAGHQFGNFTMLGDGRALLIGEHITSSGERFDIQLKGSGRTPYSRGGDGRAALGPMLREYIISEAMYALGIPTTRSLAVVTTGEPIARETLLPGAILTRIAASHLRVGTFQFAAATGSEEELRQLVDYAINRHYPELANEENRPQALLRKVIQRQTELIAKWQTVGFIHGVMNTDNMTISGETIDYGPCAFMDTYHPGTVFSSIDVQGRYAYGNQPPIAAWNLARFAEALLPVLHEEQGQAVELAQEEISKFKQHYERYWLTGMRQKLGMFTEEADDHQLIDTLLKLMQQHKADYTNTFRALTLHQLRGQDVFATPEFFEWHEQWRARLKRQQVDDDEVMALMKQHNPSIIPRNHRVEEALQAAVEKEDYTVLKRLLHVLKEPYAYIEEQEPYTHVPDQDEPYRTFCGT